MGVGLSFEAGKAGARQERNGPAAWASPRSCHKTHHTEERHDETERWKRTRGRRRPIARGKDKREQRRGGGAPGDKREERGAHERTRAEEDKAEEKSILQDKSYTNTTAGPPHTHTVSVVS